MMAAGQQQGITRGEQPPNCADKCPGRGGRFVSSYTNKFIKRAVLVPGMSFYFWTFYPCLITLNLPLILSVSLQWRLWPSDLRLTAAILLKEPADCDLLSPAETLETTWSATTTLTTRSIL